MKIKTVAAAGALGLGIGFVGMVAGTGTANAACGDLTTPPLERVRCLTEANLEQFGASINPANQINTFLNGTTDPDTGENDGLGILDQPATFVQSLQDFASGPVAP
jgi:hypothetical protein